MADNDNFGSFVAGILTGAVIGALATILYAPKSGDETRTIIKDKTDDILGKANVSVDDAFKQAESAAREARDKFDELANATKEKAAEFSQKGQVVLEERISNLKKKAEKIGSEIEEEIKMPEEKAEEAAEEKPAEA